MLGLGVSYSTGREYKIVRQNPLGVGTSIGVTMYYGVGKTYKLVLKNPLGVATSRAGVGFVIV